MLKDLELINKLINDMKLDELRENIDLLRNVIDSEQRYALERIKDDYNTKVYERLKEDQARRDMYAENDRKELDRLRKENAELKQRLGYFESIIKGVGTEITAEDLDKKREAK